jgi:exopolyphosphatase/guanosine-5'-triphosphate,3'-diphosphate pyrophosphatase
MFVYNIRTLGSLLQTFLMEDNMSKRLGIIDMGTNTFHLLITDIIDDKPLTLVNEKSAVGLGKGGINQGIITDEAIDRAIKTLKEFRVMLDAHQVGHVIATGTSAVRTAKNKQQFIDRIKKEVNIDVEVIDGVREAELIFRAVQEAIQMDDKPHLAMDIGGGSVEFIIGDSKKIIYRQSFEIGGQRLVERFHMHDPMREEDRLMMHNYFDIILKPLDEAIKKYKPIQLIGCSGTFDTLAEMNILHHREKILLEKQMRYLMSIVDFKRMRTQMVRSTRAERLEFPGMIELRVDMVVVAMCLIEHVLKFIQTNAIMVSTYSLKEGVLYTMLDGEKVGSSL